MKRFVKKALAVLLSLCMALPAFPFVACATLAFDSLTVNISTVKRQYYVGDDVDFTGIKATVKYSDTNENKTLTYNDLTFDYASDITATAGDDKVVTVKYADPLFDGEVRKAYFTINVDPMVNPNPEPAVTFNSLTVNLNSVDRLYFVGDDVDFSGIQATVSYSDETKNKTLTFEDLTLEYDENLTATDGDEKLVTVKYEDPVFDGVIRETYFTVNVAPVSGGNLQPSVMFNSLTVDLDSIDREYNVGDTVDFSGIEVEVKYSDETQNKTLTYDDLIIEFDANITASAGKDKRVTVKYEDPLFDGKIRVVYFTVNVSLSVESSPVPSSFIVTSFEAPTSLTSFNSRVNGADDAKEGAFFKDSAENGIENRYLVGDDNAFVFKPVMRGMTIGVDTIPATVSNYHSTAKVYLVNGDSSTELTATDGIESNTVNYVDSNTNVLVTANVYRQEYQFTPNAIGKTFKISVLPLSTYNYEAGRAVETTITVVDGFNVYKPVELAVIDQSNVGHTDEDDDVNYVVWDDVKASNGLTGINPNAVILHNDLVLTENDVPQGLLTTATQDSIIYNNGSPTIRPAGTKYLKDGSDIFRRDGAGSLAIHGNYFTLNLTAFPLVASIGIKGVDASFKYGESATKNDYSNATLFFVTDDIEVDPVISFENLNIIGNANRNEIVDEEGWLVGGGGLIFQKSLGAIFENKNVLTQSCFISFMAESRSKSDPESGETIFDDAHVAIVNIDYVKCYDSFQNFAYISGAGELSVSNSIVKRAGGPIVILQEKHNGEYEKFKVIPKFTATDCVLDNWLSGQEVWFDSFGASPIVALIKGLNEVVKGNNIGSYLNTEKDANGLMNIVALVIPDADGNNSVDAFLGLTNSQGIVTVNKNDKTTVLSRVLDMEHAATSTEAASYVTLGATIKGVAEAIMNTAGQPAPIFGINDVADMGVYLGDPSLPIAKPDLNNPNFTAWEAVEDDEDLLDKYQASDYITMNYGGIGIMFELLHA